MAEQVTVEQLQRDLEAHAQNQNKVTAEHADQLRTQSEHAQQHRALLDELKEGALQLKAKVEELAREYKPKSLGELVQELKAHFAQPGAVTELEQRIGSALSALEQKFLPAATWTEFRAELDSSLSKWCEQAFASLEERALGVVRHELELFTASIVPKAAPTEPAPQPSAPSSPEPLASESATDARPPEHVDPLSLARDAFPTLEEFTAIGYYPDTYEHRKAEWEARKAAANGPADGATSA